MKIKFTKLHGIGNDYIYISNLKEDENYVDISSLNLGKLAREMCDRNFGIGADGVILILPSKKAEFKMRMFNSDGSEAEMCGNGVRGFAKYLYDRQLIKKKKFKIEVATGFVTSEILIEKDGKAKMIRIDMGKPILDSAKIPAIFDKDKIINEKIKIDAREFHITSVSMGNPHCIVFVKKGEELKTKTGHIMQISTELVHSIGPKLERHEIFPNGVNVHFVRVLNRAELQMRAWERGSGETLACGTGACAALVAAVLNDRCERETTVHLLGGDLSIKWASDNHVYMTGPAVEIFRGQVSTLDI